jgi:hypothetical protein
MLGGSDTDLGRSLSLHRGKFSSGGWLWYLGGLLLLGAIAQLAQLAGLTTPTRGGEGSLGMAAASFAGGALLLLSPVLRWRQQVELFEGGFVWSRLTGQVAVRRSDVQRTEIITHHSRMGTHDEVIVHLAGGRELSMSGLSHAEQLANMLSASARPMSVPARAATPGGWRPPGA